MIFFGVILVLFGVLMIVNFGVGVLVVVWVIGVYVVFFGVLLVMFVLCLCKILILKV